MIGFVNALAILIFMAQVPHFIGISNMTYVFVAITLLIVYTVTSLFQGDSSTVNCDYCIIGRLLFISDFELRTVGDLGNITQTLPSLFHSQMFRLPLKHWRLFCLFHFNGDCRPAGKLANIINRG